jgi:hydroxymethylpyrimidine/phosphomethylpyrimidine kinase
MHGLSTRTLPMSTALDPAPLTRWMIDANAQVWKQYVEHDFVVQLGKGTLAKESFKHFIMSVPSLV